MHHGHPGTEETANFFDLQVNGFAGVDFQQDVVEEADLRRAVAGLHRCGTRRIFLTLITDAVDRLCRKLERMEKICIANPALSETIVGYHLEGPWLLAEPGFCGAHDSRLMCRPEVRELDRLMAAANGRVRLLTLAPELPGSAELIEHAAAKGVQVAAGHISTHARHRCSSFMARRTKRCQLITLGGSRRNCMRVRHAASMSRSPEPPMAFTCSRPWSICGPCCSLFSIATLHLGDAVPWPGTHIAVISSRTSGTQEVAVALSPRLGELWKLENITADRTLSVGGC